MAVFRVERNKGIIARQAAWLPAQGMYLFCLIQFSMLLGTKSNASQLGTHYPSKQQAWRYVPHLPSKKTANYTAFLKNFFKFSLARHMLSAILDWETLSAAAISTSV